MVDKLTESVSTKVSPRIKGELEDLALGEGIQLSDFVRNCLIKKLHDSKFRMKDYLQTLEEDQEKDGLQKARK